jgi:hypothetical protein
VVLQQAPAFAPAPRIDSVTRLSQARHKEGNLVGIWVKDVEDYNSAEAAVRNGMWAALGYAAWVTFSVGMTFARTDVGFLFQLMTAAEQFFFIALIAGRIGIALFAAWRFRLGKGAITGSLTALVLVAMIVFEVANGLFQGILWYVVLLAILLALISGVRGSLALRSMHNPEEVVQAFE